MGLKRAEKSGERFLNPVPTQMGSPGMMLRLIPMYLRSREEKTPKVALGPFRTEAAAYKQAPASGLRVTWFGHSSLLLEMDEVKLLLDPVWDERASPVQWGGPKRFFAPTLALEELPALDAVVLSHDHYDHLGAGTVRRLAKLMPELRWIVPLGVGGLVSRMGVAVERVTELDWTESTTVGGLTVTALPARHFSGRGLLNRFQTLWCSYVLRSAWHGVYYGADSGLWDGFAEIGDVYGPFDLTMLEIGAFHPEWAAIHMGPDGAAEAFAALGGQGLLMPIHWGLFDLALHGWRQPIERITELADERGIRLWTPEPGRPTEVVAGEEVQSGWWRRH